MYNNNQFTMQVPFIDMDSYTPDAKVLEYIKESTSKKLKALPLFKVKKFLVMAMVNTSDFIALNELKRETGLDIYPVTANETSITKAINHFYQRVDSLQDELKPIIQSLKGNKLPVEDKQLQMKTALMEEQKPVIQLVNSLVKQAVKIQASDIHLEPDEKKFRLRYRVDGILNELATFPLDMYHYIVSRIKIISNLDITESRLPQDGRAKLMIEDKEIDLRVSTFPTVYGENVVIRVLDRSILNFDMSNLGLSKEIMQPFTKAINEPYGIILVAGPTGSGKTTTLYAILNAINTISKNIVTVEDPVEFNMTMIRQSQINPKAGLTFASGLRSILRQDPDVIMVGEVRDLETAEIAIQAALTGHLVFSTIHTNDAPSTMARLTDMGAEPFLLASSINAIISQRLVRKLCLECREAYTPDHNFYKNLGIVDITEGMVFYRHKGCIHCRNQGYIGRTGIYELMFTNDKIKELVVKKASSSEIRQAALANGMITMFDDGLQKVIAGITTIDEVLRVTKLRVD